MFLEISELKIWIKKLDTSLVLAECELKKILRIHPLTDDFKRTWSKYVCDAQEQIDSAKEKLVLANKIAKQNYGTDGC